MKKNISDEEVKKLIAELKRLHEDPKSKEENERYHKKISFISYEELRRQFTI